MIQKQELARTAQEIILAHDILDGVLRKDGGLDLHISEEEQIKMRFQRDVLCWILGHEPGQEFIGNMEKVVAHAKLHGYELRMMQ